MQVVLGSRGDYTVRAVLYLARHPGRQRRKTIAEQMEIPATYLPQIMAALVRAGVVRSTVGRHGGYELAVGPGSVTLRDVIEAGEGPIRSQKCTLRGGPCYWGERCAMHEAWAAAEKALIDRLAATTFADLAMTDWEMEQRANAAGRPPDRVPRVHAPGS